MKHLPPVLPYAVSALAPHINARTLTLHHDLRPTGYVKALNLALESAPESLQDKTVRRLVVCGELEESGTTVGALPA